jgi:hypothetical protein
LQVSATKVRITRRKTLDFRPYWPLLGLFNRR